MKKILAVLICVFIILLGSACNAKETNLSSKGRQIHEPCTRIRYDENGNMIIKEKVNQYGNPEEQWFYVAADLVHHYSSKYEYDSKGRITRCETWIEDEFSHYEVDEYTGNTMIGKVYDVDGNVIQTTKGVLNDNFLTVQKEYYDNQGKFQSKETVEYDDYENIAMMERKENDGFDSIEVIEYTYKDGRPVSATSAGTSYYNGQENSSELNTLIFVY